MDKAKCLECVREFDLSDMHFVDQDGMPIVLSCQIEGRASKKKVYDYLENVHQGYDYGEEEALVYNRNTPNLSHLEPGDEGHKLVGVPKGYWKFDD